MAEASLCARRGTIDIRFHWCGRPDSNRHRPFGPTDFLTSFGFRRLATHVRAEASLWSGLSLHLGVRPAKASALGAAHLVSTPSRRTSVRQAWLGIATCEVSPTLGSSTSPVSRRALKLRSSPLRLPVSPRPHNVDSYRLGLRFDQEHFRTGLVHPHGISFFAIRFGLRILSAAASKLILK